MDRKDFLQKSILAGAALAISPTLIKGEELFKNAPITINQIGFNHLPNNEIKTMNTILHKADTRGLVDHGWLKAQHSFSFANYYNPERMNFGVLRVLNDDKIAAGEGFGMHPHDNMEIITIPFEGALEHKDDMENGTAIQAGDVQVMSAGTGIFHSEFASKSGTVKLFQIWLFPNKKNVTPRYDQLTLQLKNNTFNQILSPNAEDEGVWIHQNAWFHIGKFDAGEKQTYTLKDPKNGVYAMVIDGNITIAKQKLTTRDGFGIWNTKTIEVEANSSTQVLFMEVPMTI